MVEQLNFVDHVIVVIKLFELQLIKDLLHQQNNDYKQKKKRISQKNVFFLLIILR